MSWYPQFGAGSVAQFPVGRSRRWRTITNSRERRTDHAARHGCRANRVGVVLSGSDRTPKSQSLTPPVSCGTGRVRGVYFYRPAGQSAGWSEDLSAAGLAGRVACRPPAAWRIRWERSGRGRWQIRTRRPDAAANAGRSRRLCCVFQRLACRAARQARSRWRGTERRRP